MASRQDQLHSYQLMTQRGVSALLTGDSDPTRSPFRRAAGAALASVLMAAIAIGGVAGWGLLTGDEPVDWRDGGMLIVEDESGARFLWYEQRLHPVPNYASALLLLGGAAARTVRVPRTSLDGVPRGAPLGIADAPDSLPEAGELVSDPWTLCSTVDSEGPRSLLLVGGRPRPGTGLADDAMLVRVPDGAGYLVWQQRRHLVRDPEVTLPALGLAGEQPVPVAAALLETLPAGADLARITVPGLAETSAVLPEAQVGQVFVVRSQGGDRQFGIVLRDGLAPLTAVQVDLVLTDPRIAAAVGQREPMRLSQAQLAGTRWLDAEAVGGAGWPATSPPLARVDPGAAVCVVVAGETGVRSVITGAGLPSLAGVMRTSGRSADGGVLADHVVVAPGRGAVVVAGAAPGPGPGPGPGPVSVVTDLGLRYPVPGAEVLSMLGYGAVSPVRMPESLVSLVPAGPVLDPERARMPATPGASPGASPGW